MHGMDVTPAQYQHRVHKVPINQSLSEPIKTHSRYRQPDIFDEIIQTGAMFVR